MVLIYGDRMAISDLARLIKGECGELYNELETVFRRIKEIDAEMRRAVLDGRMDDAQKFGEELKELESRADRLTTEVVLKCTRLPRRVEILKKDVRSIFEKRY